MLCRSGMDVLKPNTMYFHKFTFCIYRFLFLDYMIHKYEVIAVELKLVKIKSIHSRSTINSPHHHRNNTHRQYTLTDLKKSQNNLK